MPGMIIFFVIKDKSIKCVLSFLMPSVSLLGGLTASVDTYYHPAELNLDVFFIEEASYFLIILFV